MSVRRSCWASRVAARHDDARDSYLAKGDGRVTTPNRAHRQGENRFKWTTPLLRPTIAWRKVWKGPEKATFGGPCGMAFKPSRTRQNPHFTVVDHG